MNRHSIKTKINVALIVLTTVILATFGVYDYGSSQQNLNAREMSEPSAQLQKMVERFQV